MQLPVVDLSHGTHQAASPSFRRRQLWADRSWHLLRLTLIVVLLLGLHRWVALRSTQRQAVAEVGISLSAARSLLPAAHELRGVGHGRVEALSVAGESLGILATTLPEANDVIGYSGPSNVLLALTPEQQIQSVQLLSSGDTREHVALVERDHEFWKQFAGMAWGAADLTHIDGVSGATLTSLAIAEGIALRMSGQRQSLRFPEPVSLGEVQDLVPNAVRISLSQWNGLQAWEVWDANETSLGSLVRTGNLVDSIEGYQGPSELLFWLSAEGDLLAARVRHSYDNQPYVGYIRQEYSFWPLFTSRGLNDLATMDLEAEGVEGVSGATMTSMAVAATVKAAAERLTAGGQTASAKSHLPTWNGSVAEVATGLLALLSLFWSRSHLRGRTRWRLLWQMLCLAVIGLWTGNLLSLALLAGWTRGGLPYHLAPGLSLLLFVALITPAVSKHNVYCDQLCPHGILQQWLRPMRRQKLRPQAHSLPRSAVVGLQITRSICLLAAAGWLIWDWPLSLTWLEPFDAYAWRIGLSISGLVCLLSLAIAWWRPMAYCQLACPTGRLLECVRHRRRNSHSWRVDCLLASSAAAVWGLQWYHAW